MNRLCLQFGIKCIGMARLARVGLPQDSSLAQQGGEASPGNGDQLEMAVRGKSYLSWLGDQLALF